MTLTALPLGRVLHESSARMRHVYFPVSGLISLVTTLEDGATAELAVVGSDGCLGIAILLGGGTTPSRAVVQIAGQAYQVPSAAMLEEFHRQGRLQFMLLRYIQARITQISQTAVCNRHHTVEQQLCRWLLLTLDRVPSNDVRMTQELISTMLGVRRTGVTQAARTLEQAGLIENRRGVITVTDRAKLEAHACECYAAIKRETDRLLCGGFDGLHAVVAPRAAGSTGP
jgi:CRP-like cAMP-binding protein